MNLEQYMFHKQRVREVNRLVGPAALKGYTKAALLLIKVRNWHQAKVKQHEQAHIHKYPA